MYTEFLQDGEQRSWPCTSTWVCCISKIVHPPEQLWVAMKNGSKRSGPFNNAVVIQHIAERQNITQIVPCVACSFVKCQLGKATSSLRHKWAPPSLPPGPWSSGDGESSTCHKKLDPFNEFFQTWAWEEGAACHINSVKVGENVTALAPAPQNVTTESQFGPKNTESTRQLGCSLSLAKLNSLSPWVLAGSSCCHCNVLHQHQVL